MEILKIFYIIIILILLIILIFKFYETNSHSKNIYNDDNINIVINMKNFTRENHVFYNKLFEQLNSTRNHYFIKMLEQQLNVNLNDIVENSTVKIVQSNFPDSIFLPLVLSLYGDTVPEFVLFIEGEDLIESNINELIKWIDNSYTLLKNNKYDYIFGNYQIIDGKKIGCSILFSNASIIQHLLYNTDSDTTHMNPFIQLSIATQTKFTFIPLNNTKSSILENINGKLSIDMHCPTINAQYYPSLCVIIPTLKRDYFYESMPAFAKQTYRPKFYLIYQNDNRRQFNFSYIQSQVNEPVYHIWMSNWNSFFFLHQRFSALLPCDLILRYDDDQWPKDDDLQQKLIYKISNKNIMIGFRGLTLKSSYCGYEVNKKKVDGDVKDNIGVPLLVRQGYYKLDARNKIFSIYGLEDFSLSLNTYKLCNVSSIQIKMDLIERQHDGKNQIRDKQINNAIKKEAKNETNFDLFKSYLCFLIHSGYIPKRWDNFTLPKEDYINILLNHKRLN